MSLETMKLALEALEGLEALLLSMGLTHLIVYGDAEKAITNLQKQLEEQPAQRKPLTLGQKQRLWSSVGDKPTLKDRVNAYGLAIEAAHGIKENT